MNNYNIIIIIHSDLHEVTAKPIDVVSTHLEASLGEESLAVPYFSGTLYV